MKTHDMSRSDKERKAAQERMMAPMAASDGEDYPHGLHVHLDQDSMKKVGITDKNMPKKGDKYRMEGGAKVLGTEDGMYGGGPQVHLVLHQLGLEPAGEPEKERSIRDELEDARHQARGTTAPTGRLGRQAADEEDEDAA